MVCLYLAIITVYACTFTALLFVVQYILYTDAAYRFYWSKAEIVSIRRRGMDDEKSKMKRRYERRARVSTCS